MIRFFLVFILLSYQNITFGQCSEFSNFHYLDLDSLLKKNNANIINDKTFGIHYSKFYFDHKNGDLHILKSINILDSFDLQIDTTLFNDLNSNHFGTINPSDFFNEIIEVLTIITTENNFYVFSSINGCQMIDLLPDFINQYFPPMSEAEKNKYWDVLQPRFQRFYNYCLEALQMSDACER